MATQAMWTAAIQLAPEPLSEPRARDFVAHHLGHHNLAYLVHDVQSVVTELVSSSIQHAGTLMDVELQEKLFCVLLTVHDRSSASPVVRLPSADGAESPSLMLIGERTLHWGVEPDERGGKSVWVVFGLQPPDFQDWASTE